MTSSIMKKRSNIEDDDNKNNKHQRLDHEQINLQTCMTCHRRFTENRLVEHQRACKPSVNPSHRYHYNSQLHRWKGLDYHINTKKHQIRSPKTFWREKHRTFQGIIKGQDHPTEENPTDRPYQCSQCQRKFATENARTKHQKGCSSSRRQIRNLKKKF